MACRICRARKVKCDRTRPSCKNCLLRGNECIYTGERREPRRRRMLHQGRPGVQDHHASYPSSSSAYNQIPPRLLVPAFRWERNVSISLPSSEEESVATPEQITKQHWQVGLLDAILDDDDDDMNLLQDRHPAIWMRTDNAEEYSGPSSGIAAISDIGLKWICSQVPESDELCRIIQYVRNGLLTHLRNCMPPQPTPDPELPPIWKRLPPPETVYEYVNAYFSKVQTIFPVVEPAKFNEMLAEWYREPERQMDSWKALLNAVLASGCRAALSDDTASAFTASSNESWGFFQNALNYEPKLVHNTTDVLSVQALTVMAVFAQGMSCSQRLEYILCSTAARLAYSLGLNRHVPTHWDMSDTEKRERYRLFWVIYCLDKGIASRSGRPPVIQDDDISCPFPRDIQYGTPDVARHNKEFGIEEPQFDFFFFLTKFYRILSLVVQSLYSTAALRRPTSELQNIADEILARLEVWRESIPLQFRPGRSLSSSTINNCLLRTQTVALHFSYYYAICATHRRFTAMFTQEIENDNPGEWTSRGSPTRYIEAARSMALLTRHLDIESYAPAWLIFYYPTTALVTIFMHTITAPLSPSACHDIALMETVAGFFGRLEFMTLGEAAFTRTSEFARQARRMIEQATDQGEDTDCRSTELTETNGRLGPVSGADSNSMEDPYVSRNVAGLLTQATTTLQPISPAFAESTRQQNLGSPIAQINALTSHNSEEEHNQPLSRGRSSNPCYNMTPGLDMSLPDVLDEYLLDQLLHANGA
ncbi:fungal-specific transcription factor domain-containing protein [Aspergillus arachidicola]|uniref:Fungal-specific transcription factor domain-containing protein n=1 Tax=Aspergillus arachidicola TaxID=656916 RepID=A0A5N6Y0U2_9EURO|nr:fungal-specific transcription factor domain-containing protein [Aspergillus arachidicola]